MDPETKRTLKIAKTLTSRGMTMKSVRVQTPDGRLWEIDAVATGRGRFPDGHWGIKEGASGGFRLFELTGELRQSPEEHDAVDGDVWDAGDLADYLNAIGQPKTSR